MMPSFFSLSLFATCALSLVGLTSAAPAAASTPAVSTDSIPVVSSTNVVTGLIDQMKLHTDALSGLTTLNQGVVTDHLNGMSTIITGAIVQTVKSPGDIMSLQPDDIIPQLGTLIDMVTDAFTDVQELINESPDCASDACDPVEKLLGAVLGLVGILTQAIMAILAVVNLFSAGVLVNILKGIATRDVSPLSGDIVKNLLAALLSPFTTLLASLTTIIQLGELQTLIGSLGIGPLFSVAFGGTLTNDSLLGKILGLSGGVAVLFTGIPNIAGIDLLSILLDVLGLAQ